MEKIELQNITKRFDDRLVLDNISFSIDKGEIFGLIGPNGAGKSTLINIIIGLLHQDNGQVFVDGTTISEDSVAFKRKIGLIPQELALIETLNAYDNLEYFGTFYGLYGKELKKAINEVLEITGLEDRKKKVKDFSGGMKRRLNIAVALMHHPQILIMDEPTVGVDPQSRNHIFDCIKKINQEEGTTVIYTSHYMEEVEYLCNRIFIIDEGKKISFGTKNEIKKLLGTSQTIDICYEQIPDLLLEELKQLEKVKEIEIVSEKKLKIIAEESLSLDEIITISQGLSAKIKSVNVEEVSLEEVFLSLTGKRLRD